MVFNLQLRDVRQIDIEENRSSKYKNGESLLSLLKDSLEIMYSRKFDHSCSLRERLSS